MKRITISMMMSIMAVSFGQVVLKNNQSFVVPKLLNYQGYLTDDQGNPTNNPSLSMTFSIYDASSSGAQLWTEDQTISVSKGIFNATLGSVAAIPNSVFRTGTDRWLELTVGAQVLAPRTRITAMGYAYSSIHADTAEYAITAPPDSDWIRGPDSTLLTVRQLGLGRGGAGNIFWGNSSCTHTNFGVACTTGAYRQNNSYVTVGGGYGNNAKGTGGTIVGGHGNIGESFFDVYFTIGGGFENKSDGSYTTIAGGRKNRAYSAFTTVAGGDSNVATGTWATVGGGRHNMASDSGTTVGGGTENTASGNYSTICGGSKNLALSGGAVVVGGILDTAFATYGAILGGYHNRTGDGASDTGTVVVGGRDNVASGVYSFVGGGAENTASGRYSTIGGGKRNVCSVVQDSVDYAVIGGGSDNTIGGHYYGTTSGGYHNTNNGDYSTISGGQWNFIGLEAANATIGGGKKNKATGIMATVCGGDSNTAEGSFSIVGGGSNNIASGDNSLAAGSGSQALHSNSVALNGEATTASGQTRVGILSKVSGTFTIDHPLDPDNKILNHYFVESPEMVLVYRGVTSIGSYGRVLVRLPDYFNALNKNPMIQLTGVRTPDVYVEEEVKGNSFIIGGKPGAKVFWTVTGERKDQSAEITKILMPVEQPKDGGLAGRSLNDNFLCSTRMQLERMGKADEFQFRTSNGRQSFENMKRRIAKNR